ncbi:MAG: hypothetical protein QOF55_911 [Thermoleophilaceae bacterium]|nr:hypothetical protein [Thermoleophilaceae bacterium]
MLKMTRTQAAALAAAAGGLAAVLATVLVLGAGGSSAAASAKLNPQQLRGILTAWAHSNGEASPRNMRAIETDRVSALRVTAPGDNVQGDAQDVYAMVATGKFTGYKAHIPRGEAAPTGDYLSLVVDSTTGEILDWGLTPDPPDLSSLGATTGLGQ